MKIPTQPSLRALVALTALACISTAQADPVPADADAREQKLERHVEELAQQLQAVQAELQALKAQNQAAATTRSAPPSPSLPTTQQPVQVAAASPAPAAAPSSPFENLSLWGYGEIYYT